jgi:predicted Rossmann fold nucleotide-binding protein DprA/Smf involved in DNA uptake
MKGARRPRPAPEAAGRGGILDRMPADLSPIARTVLLGLEAGPATAEELAATTHLPAGVVDAALAELRSAGRVEQAEGSARSARARVRT